MTLIELIFLIFMKTLPTKIIKICVYQVNLRSIDLWLSNSQHLVAAALKFIIHSHDLRVEAIRR